MKNLPFTLFFDGKPVAKLITFSYETPWGAGKVEFDDSVFHQTLINITTFVFFDVEVEAQHLPEDEEDALLDEKLSELNLVWEDTKYQVDGRWEIEMTIGEKQPIFAVRFDPDHFIEFRL